jgi:putative transcriptional regulator
VKVLHTKLKEIRTSNNLSQEALAESVGVTRQTIISIEKETYQPSTSLALKLANALHKKVEDIFYLS